MPLPWSGQVDSLDLRYTQEADPGLTAAHPRAVAETLKNIRTLGHAIVSCS